MMARVQLSEIVNSGRQIDGRIAVVEQHTLSDGRRVMCSYLAEPGTMPAKELATSAARIDAEEADLGAKAAEKASVRWVWVPVAAGLGNVIDSRSRVRASAISQADALMLIDAAATSGADRG